MAVHVVKVWDWPVRVCHWSFAMLVPALWWTAENSEMAWHMRLGQLLLGLVIFRIAWGFLGSSTARFADFVRGPVTILKYLSGKSPANLSKQGHNPLGGLAVLALLALMLVQTSTGLFAGDPFDGATGPLNETVGVLTADFLTEWHETVFWVLVGMIAVHLTAIVVYQGVLFKSLVEPMISGNRAVDDPEGAMVAAPFWRLLLSIAIACVVVIPIATGMVSAALAD